MLLNKCISKGVRQLSEACYGRHCTSSCTAHPCPAQPDALLLVSTSDPTRSTPSGSVGARRRPKMPAVVLAGSSTAQQWSTQNLSSKQSGSD